MLMISDQNKHFLYNIHSFHQKTFRIEDVQIHDSLEITLSEMGSFMIDQEGFGGCDQCNECFDENSFFSIVHVQSHGIFVPGDACFYILVKYLSLYCILIKIPGRSDYTLFPTKTGKKINFVYLFIKQSLSQCPRR